MLPMLGLDSKGRVLERGVLSGTRGRAVEGKMGMVCLDPLCLSNGVLKI